VRRRHSDRGSGNDHLRGGGGNNLIVTMATGPVPSSASTSTQSMEGSEDLIADPHDSLSHRRASDRGEALRPPIASEKFILKFATALRKTTAGAVAVATVTLGFGLGQGAASAVTPLVSATPMATVIAYHAPRLSRMVAEAIHQTTLGIMYSSGGGHNAHPASLGSRVDCSGFVREMYEYGFGVDIGNGSGDSIIRTSGEFTKTSHPVPGDVALFGNGGQAPAYHAGIYIGMINGHPAAAAASSTGTPLLIQQWYNRYWSGDLIGYYHFNRATAADSGPRVQPKMTGSLDAVSGVTGGFRVSGWAVDPQRKSYSGSVGVTVDGRSVANLATDTYRADVNRVAGATGNHGFSAGISTAVGRHTVCVIAHAAGTSSAAVSLGCRAVTVPRPANGSFDSATGTKRTFAVSGWAFDPNVSGSNSLIRVTLDGRTVANTRAAAVRADVDRIFGITGNHGFHVRIAAAAGQHTVCTVALPASASTYARKLGCKAVKVTA